MNATRRGVLGALGAASTAHAAPRPPAKWERRLSEVVPEFGHRNWIVVADSAYPAQAKAGIESILANADQALVVERVLQAVAASGHVTPNVHLDLELNSVDEAAAPGIASYRRRLDALLAGHMVTRIPHEQLIAKLDAVGQIFRVLIVKTRLKLPYTSVFFELGCAYWNAEAEQQLRRTLIRQPGGR